MFKPCTSAVPAVDIALRNEMVAVEVDGTAHWTQVCTSGEGCPLAWVGATSETLPCPAALLHCPWHRTSTLALPAALAAVNTCPSSHPFPRFAFQNEPYVPLGRTIWRWRCLGSRGWRLVSNLVGAVGLELWRASDMPRLAPP